MRLLPQVGLCLLLAICSLGCEDLFTPRGTTATRNYDELVNRMMNSMKNRTPEDAAANLFNVTSPDERRDAIAWLATKKWGHEPPYMRAYEALATDPHPMVRAQAMMAMGSSYKPLIAVPVLMKGLKDKDVQVRRDAAYGLMFTWDDSAFPDLIATLKDDPDEMVRGNCARALKYARTPEAVRQLIDAVGDRDAAVSKFAHDSLVLSTGQNHWYNQRAWLTWYQETYLATPTPSGPSTQPVQPG
jgi:hypothetical protein